MATSNVYEWWAEHWEKYGHQYTKEFEQEANDAGLYMVAVRGPGNELPEGPQYSYDDCVDLHAWLRERHGFNDYVFEVEADCNGKQSYILFPTSGAAVEWMLFFADTLKNKAEK